MRLSNLENRVIDPFVFTLKQQGTESFNAHSGRPVLYLKCWGPDYPYLRGVEQQKRWLPVVPDSVPRT